MQFNLCYYDAALSRFVSADTIVASFGNPQSLNRYSYVYNNPINSTDPTGHMVASDGDGGCGKCKQPTKGNTPTNGAGNKPANQAKRARDTSGNGFTLPPDPASYSPNNGVYIIAARDTRAFLRGELGVGQGGVTKVRYIQMYLDDAGGIVTGAETNIDLLDLGPMTTSVVVGDDGMAGTQLSVSTPGPIHLIAQAQDSIQAGIEAEAKTPSGSVRAAALAGLDLGTNSAEFLTSQGYFDSVGAKDFIKANLPGGRIVSIVVIRDTPARTTPTGCYEGVTGYRTMLNMFNIDGQRLAHMFNGGWTRPKVIP